MRSTVRTGDVTPVKKLTKVPKGVQLEVPAPRFIPELTPRRDTGIRLDRIAAAIERARRAFFFGKTTPEPTWIPREPSPTVWNLVQELRRLEGMPPIAQMAPEL